MREDFLHFVWQHALFDSTDLRTTDGQNLQLLDRGTLNRQSGPDFSHARVRIGNTTWAGHVEIHTRSSEWYRHGHQGDGAYHNVVLHVVYENDKPVVLPGGVAIPTMELSGRISEEQYWRYERWLKGSGEKVLCASQISETPGHIIDQWLDIMSRERLEQKSDEAMRLLEISEGNVDWVEAVMTARAFGKPLNSPGMEELARRLPWRAMSRRNWSQVEFDQLVQCMSGLSDARPDEHIFRLWALTSLDRSWWKWGQMRPASFPLIRIRQWSWWIWHRIVKRDIEIAALLKKTDCDWRIGGEQLPRPSATTRQRWFINAYGPMVHAYHRWGLPEIIPGHAPLWAEVPAENNGTVETFKKWGVPVHHAGHSQALIHCYRNYCTVKKCVNCHLGMYHLKRLKI